MRIYISATFKDLKEHRAAVYDTLRKMRHDVIAMEDYVAADERPLDVCLNDVRSCDIYIGLFAWRVGYIPPGKEKGITELELREAISADKSRLLFLLKEDHPWPRDQIDRDPSSIEALRDEVATTHTVSFFTTPDNLAALVGASVARFETQSINAIADTTQVLESVCIEDCLGSLGLAKPRALWLAKEICNYVRRVYEDAQLDRDSKARLDLDHNTKVAYFVNELLNCVVPQRIAVHSIYLSTGKVSQQYRALRSIAPSVPNTEDPITRLIKVHESYLKKNKLTFPNSYTLRKLQMPISDDRLYFFRAELSLELPVDDPAFPRLRQYLINDTQKSRIGIASDVFGHADAMVYPLVTFRGRMEGEPAVMVASRKYIRCGSGTISDLGNLFNGEPVTIIGFANIKEAKGLGLEIQPLVWHFAHHLIF